MTPDARIESLKVSAFKVPCTSPEADGTCEWDHTIIVVVEVGAGGETGLGYSYTGLPAALLIEQGLREHVIGASAFSMRTVFNAMYRAVRNLGRDGVASTAISAVDVALWDLKARLLGVSLVDLLGAAREAIPVYGSGGFTTYTKDQLQNQLKGWTDSGIGAVKMKIGSHPEDDLQRVRWAREAIGDAELFVDANGAYDRKQALEQAFRFAECRVSWFEEPVSSDDLEGLRLMRDRGPAGMEIAAGEYGYSPVYFRRMLEAGAVDVLQADGTRCGGITGFLNAAEQADAFGIPLSAHTAPSIHGHLCCASSRARHVEYFHDHARIEAILFEGALQARDGVLRPDRDARGLGLRLRPEAEWADLAERTQFGAK